MIKTELSDSNFLSNNKRSQFLKQLNSEFIDNFDIVFSRINKIIFKEIGSLTICRASKDKEHLVKKIKSLIQESNSLLDFIVSSKKMIYNKFIKLNEELKNDDFEICCNLYWVKPEPGTLKIGLSFNNSKNKVGIISQTNIKIGELNLIPFWNSYSGETPTETEKERLEKLLKDSLKIIFLEGIKKQYELSLSTEIPDGHLKLVRKGEMFWELADYDSIKNNQTVHSTLRFLSNGLSKVETLKLLEILKEILDKE